jgi:hypothetical protein
MRKIIILVLWLTFSQIAWATSLPSVPVPEGGSTAARIAYWENRYRYNIDDIFSQTQTINTMVNILKSYGIPEEAVCLSMAESELDPWAYNQESGAKGPWQFIATTAVLYGLRVDFIDERTDVVKSTHAACRYLLHLYDLFKNWNLAFATYNGGEVDGSRDFWSYSEDKIGSEPYNHVPKILAYIKIARERGLFTGDYRPEPGFRPRAIAGVRQSHRVHSLAEAHQIRAKQTLPNLALVSRPSINEPAFQRKKTVSKAESLQILAKQTLPARR